MSTPSPEMRIGDQEREAAVTALGEHYAAGRLTKDEYDDRASAAYSARTSSALRPLFGDLPGPHPYAAATRESSGRPRPNGPGSWAGGTGWGPRPPSGATGPGTPRTGFRLPLLPLLFVLLGLAILLEAPWLVFIGLGALFFARAHRRGSSWAGCGSKAHGNR